MNECSKFASDNGANVNEFNKFASELTFGPKYTPDITHGEGSFRVAEEDYAELYSTWDGWKKSNSGSEGPAWDAYQEKLMQIVVKDVTSKAMNRALARAVAAANMVSVGESTAGAIAQAMEEAVKGVEQQAAARQSIKDAVMPGLEKLIKEVKEQETVNAQQVVQSIMGALKQKLEEPSHIKSAKDAAMQGLEKLIKEVKEQETVNVQQVVKGIMGALDQQPEEASHIELARSLSALSALGLGGIVQEAADSVHTEGSSPELVTLANSLAMMSSEDVTCAGVKEAHQAAASQRSAGTSPQMSEAVRQTVADVFGLIMPDDGKASAVVDALRQGIADAGKAAASKAADAAHQGIAELLSKCMPEDKVS